MTTRAGVLILLMLLLAPASGHAATDRSFNGGEPVTTELDCAHRNPEAILQFPDGDVGMAGSQTQYLDDCQTPADVPGTFVARRNADGTPDSGYGGSPEGVAVTGFLTRVADATVLPDGSVLIFGMQREGFGPEYLAVVKLGPAGGLDTSFGDGGRALLPWSSESGSGEIAIQPDGRIVLSTSSAEPRPNPDGSTTVYSVPTAYRLTGAGAPDETFSTDGRAFRLLEDEPAPFYVELAVQPTGRIVVGGSTFTSGPAGGEAAGHAFMVAFTSSGADDGSFGDAAGKLIATAPGDRPFTDASMASAPDGGLLMAGKTWEESTYSSVMLRTSADGRRDETWGPSGVKKVPGLARPTGEHDRLAVWDVAFDAAARILAAGTVVTNGYMSGGSVARLDPAGSLDTGFADGGFADITSSGSAYRVAVDAADRPLVHGSVQGTQSTIPWLARVAGTGGAGTGTGGSTGTGSSPTGDPITDLEDLARLVLRPTGRLRGRTARFRVGAPSAGSIAAVVTALTARASAARTVRLGRTTKRVTRAGRITLKVKLKGRAAKRLMRRKRFKVRLRTVFTPAGGTRGPAVRRTVKLKR